MPHFAQAIGFIGKSRLVWGKSAEVGKKLIASKMVFFPSSATPSLEIVAECNVTNSPTEGGVAAKRMRVVPSQFLINNDEFNTRYPSLANLLGDIMYFQKPPRPNGHPSRGGELSPLSSATPSRV